MVYVAESFGFSNSQVGGQRRVVLDPVSLEKIREKAKSNIVHTTQYNAINFIPFNLFQQFKKAANVYFLLIAMLQTVKMVTISDGQATMLPPLITVVCISMFKDGYEDYVRYQEDKKENFSKTIKLAGGREVPANWGEVLVGDILLVK